MRTWLSVIQIIISILLTAAILMQRRGTGLSATFGGEGNIYRTKRGLEKAIFAATVILAILFFGSALANIIFP
ncbi:MAG: preprotein translocase subunit SecG [Candidatus Sungbacteria bacterium]|nr:preprotein translocase subunit SecG [Candidatus Sungbacteria bacterium]